MIFPALRFALNWLYAVFCSTLVLAGACVGLGTQAWIRVVGRWARGGLSIAGIQFRVSGSEHLRGPAVIIANHQSMIDALLLPAIVPPTTRMIAKREVRRIPVWGWALASSGGILIDRTQSVSAVERINDAVRQLPAGWSVLVFPEGTRSPEGVLRPFKKGAFHIAMQARLPIVPIGIAPTSNVLPKGSCLPKKGVVFANVGSPIDTSEWAIEGLDAHIAAARHAVECCIESAKQRQSHCGGRRHPRRSDPVVAELDTETASDRENTENQCA